MPLLVSSAAGTREIETANQPTSKFRSLLGRVVEQKRNQFGRPNWFPFRSATNISKAQILLKLRKTSYALKAP